jgi:hypothetical protein
MSIKCQHFSHFLAFSNDLPICKKKKCFHADGKISVCRENGTFRKYSKIIFPIGSNHTIFMKKQLTKFKFKASKKMSWRRVSNKKRLSRVVGLLVRKKEAAGHHAPFQQQPLFRSSGSLKCKLLLMILRPTRNRSPRERAEFDFLDLC